MRVALSVNQRLACAAIQCRLIAQPLWRSFVFHKFPKNRGLQRVTDCIH